VIGILLIGNGGLLGRLDPDSRGSSDHMNHLLVDGDGLHIAFLNRRGERTADGGGDDEKSLHLHDRADDVKDFGCC
jgi:hypothetical protein